MGLKIDDFNTEAKQIKIDVLTSMILKIETLK